MMVKWWRNDGESGGENDCENGGEMMAKMMVNDDGTMVKWWW